MRVLFVIAHVDKGGGQVVQSLQLVRRLLTQVEGELIALSTPGTPSTAFGLEVDRVGSLRFPGGIFELRRAIRDRRSQVDVVQALDSYYALPAARLARAHPLVVRSGAHPVEDLASRYGTLARIGAGIVNPWLLSDTTVVVNAEHLRAAYRGPRVVCIPNGVDTERFAWPRNPAAARTELGLPVGVPLVAFTGKIIPRKNVEDLYRLARALPEVHVLLVGTDREPYYGDRYHREVRADFADVLPRVHAVGEVAAERIPRLLEAADLFVFPSRLEGMPNSVLEAMAAGVPVVAADTAAHREILPPGTGLLYRTSSELPELVWGLLDDPDRARSIGENARHEVERKHSLEVAATAYARLYESLVGRSG